MPQCDLPGIVEKLQSMQQFYVGIEPIFQGLFIDDISVVIPQSQNHVHGNGSLNITMFGKLQKSITDDAIRRPGWSEQG